MRGSLVMRFDSGVPSRPTRSTSTPFDTSACAWYCMRALRPRSPSATRAALIREYGLEGGAAILSRFEESALEQAQDGQFLGPERGFGPSGPLRTDALRGPGCQRHAIHIRIENRRMDVTPATHRLRIPEAFGHLFNGLDDVPLGFARRLEAGDGGERRRRHHGTRPRPKILGCEVRSAQF